MFLGKACEFTSCISIDYCLCSKTDILIGFKFVTKSSILCLNYTCCYEVYLQVGNLIKQLWKHFKLRNMYYLAALKLLCGFCFWSHDCDILNFYSSQCCSLTHVDNFLDTSVSKVWLFSNSFGHWHAKQQLRKNDNKGQEFF